MNRTYKLVWNTTLQAWTVASEMAKGRKKSSGKSLKLALLLLTGIAGAPVYAAPAVNALPTAESVAVGSGTFDRTVLNKLTVNQTSPRLIVNWGGFDVGSAAMVQFVQPSSSSIVLNRISSGPASQIFGQVYANGALMVVNPSGITFGAGSQVSAASIVASVLDIANNSLNNGTNIFNRGSATGSVENYGTLTATSGGVALLAPTVISSGSIAASGGNASLINANQVDLSTAVPSVTQASTIAGVINSTGSIQSTVVSSVGGRIFLTGDTSQGSSNIQLGGTVNASTDTTVNGRVINITKMLDVNGTNNILKLTHTAGYNLNGGPINLNGTSSGFNLNNLAYTIIRNVTQLQAMTSNRAGRYALAGDIDASTTSSLNGGAGFIPIGDYQTAEFTGTLDGLGHSIINLNINRPTEDDVALLGAINGATIRNVGLSGVNIRGGQYVAGLATYCALCTINNVYVTGSVTGGLGVAGLLSDTANTTAASTISNTYSTASVSGTTYVGGLIGYMGHGTLSNSYASGLVTGTDSASNAGLVGQAANTVNITNSYWNTQTTGRAQATGTGGTLTNVVGLTTAQSTQLASYGNWGSTIDAQGGTARVWRIYTGSTAPLLRAFLKPVTISVGGTKTYDATAYSGFTLSPGSIDTSKIVNYGSFSVTGAGVGAVNAGTYALSSNASQLYSGQLGYDITVSQGSLTINKADLWIGAGNISKTYDGTTIGNGTASVSAGTLYGSNTMSGGTFTFDSKHVGTGKTVTVSGVSVNDGNSGNNYNVTYVNNTNSTINKANLVISSSDVTKTYDGTTSATGTAVASSGTQVFAGDSLTGGSFAFSNRNAGTGKTVTVSGVTVNDGNSGNNYNVSYANNTSSTINKANLTLSSSNVTKTYDGTTAAAGTAVVSSGSLVGGDTISGGTFAFANKNAGTGKTVTVSGITVNDGNSGNNYNVSYANNTGSTINKANLVLTTSNVTKTYDGTTAAAGTAVVSSGSLLGGDTMSGGTFAFANKHAGTGKTVTTSAVTVNDGNSGNNYNVSYANNTGSTINKATLVLSTTDVTKTYDGTTDAAGTAVAANGTQVFAGDSLSGGTFVFDNRNAGTGKTVATSGVTVADGNSGNNYDVSYTDNTSSTINKASLVLSTTDVSKTYDGTTSAAGTAVVSSGSLVGGDTISGGSFTFDSKHAGTGKTVTTSAVSVDDGNSGNNYDVTYADNTNSTINKANLVLTTNDVSKTYDGTTAAAGSAVATSGTQVFSGDSLSGGTFAFDSKHAGTGKTVSTSAVTVDDGNSGNNYDVTYADNTSSTINKAALVLTTTDVSKTYDGTKAASGTAVATSGTQVFAGDSLSGGTFAFDSKHAGTGKTVTTSAVTVDDGNSGNNYDVTYADNTSSTINKAALVLTTTDVTKTYNGATDAAGTAVATSGTQVFSGDSLSGGTFAFDTKHAGTGKTVTTSGVTVDDGNSGNNYDVTYANNTSSTINKAALVLTTNDVSKTYDGTTDAAGTAVATSGTQVFSGDSISGGTFAFDTKHAGTGKTVTTSGVTVDDGNSGNNYDVTYADNTNSAINKAVLVLTTTDVTKTYNGATDAAGTAVATSGTQVFAGDNISGGNFAFDSKHAGTGKTVTTSGVTIDDGNSGNNYDVTYADNTTSTINKASLVLTTTDVSKTYDGTTDAAGTAVATSGTQVFVGDSISGGSFAFDSKHAGTGKTVSTSAVTVDDGNSGNNYDVTYADNTTSTINKASLVLSTTDVSKTYDGTTDAAGTAVATSGTQVFAGDSLSGGTFVFDNRNAGSGKTVSTSAVTVDDGNSGNNYDVTYADNTSSTINKASLSVSATDASKTYDGTTSASSTALIVAGSLFGADSFNGATVAFADKNAGTGKHLVVSNAQISDGNNGGNYAVTYVDNTNSSISKRLLTLSAVTDSKVYDGKVSSTGKPVVAGRQRGDSIAGLTQSFADKNAGMAKTLKVDGTYVIRDGNNGNNYDVVLVDNHTGVITPKALTISTVANSKVYDGGVTSANKPLVTGLVTGDRITGLFQQYETKTVGENKKLLIKNGYVLQDGNAGNNYVVTEQTGNDGVITAH